MIFNMIRTPRQVCNDAEKNDWNNVVSCFSSVGRPSQRVADAQKSRMTMLILAIVMVVMVMIMPNGDDDDRGGGKHGYDVDDVDVHWPTSRWRWPG